MTRPTSLLVVDDHVGFVDALALWVSEEPDLVLVGVATTATDGLDLLGRTGCDVVVIGHELLAERLPPDGQEVVAALRAARPSLPIVLLVSEHDEPGGDGDLLDVVAAGACGWVDRAAGLEAVLAAVRAAARGESHVPTEQVQSLLSARSAQRRESDPSRHTGLLTQRESAVLEGLAAGLSRAEIGAALHLSPNTVRTHVRSILRKCHVHSAPDALALLTERAIHHD